jgi:hypothetical protein
MFTLLLALSNLGAELVYRFLYLELDLSSTAPCWRNQALA